MSKLTDVQLLAIYNSNQSTSDDLLMLRAVADAAVAAYVADKSECLGRDKCLALANAVLNDMDCHPAFVKAMAQGPVPDTSRIMVPVDMFFELAELAEEYATQGCIVATSTERELDQLLPRIRALIASQKEQQS